MVEVHRNQRGSSAGYDIDSGWTFDEVVEVQNVSGSGQRQFVNAVACGGVPNVGAIHSAVPTVTLRSISLEGQGGANVRLRLAWRDNKDSDSPDEQDIEVGTSLQSVQTNMDVNGDLLIVRNTAEVGADREAKEQGGELSVMRPHSTIRVVRTEDGSPGEKSQQFVGKVNAANCFDLAAGAAEARTWLCSSITGHSNDSGETYRVTYEFEYDAGDWDQQIVYIDPQTGRVPDAICNAAEGSDAREQGIKSFQMYEEANFNELGLS